MESVTAQLDGNTKKMIDLSLQDSFSSSSSSSSGSSGEDSGSDESGSSSSASADSDDSRRTKEDCEPSSLIEVEKAPTVETDCLPPIEELTIADDSECKQLAGEVICTLGSHGLVIRPSRILSRVLLDLGSPLYLRHREIFGDNSWSQFARVNDVFGRVTEPLYFVNLGEQDVQISLGTQVYYAPGHPLTSFVQLQEVDHRITLEHRSPNRPLKGNVNNLATYGNPELYNYCPAGRASVKQRYSPKVERWGNSRGAVRPRPAYHQYSNKIHQTSQVKVDQNENGIGNNVPSD